MNLRFFMKEPSVADDRVPFSVVLPVPSVGFRKIRTGPVPDREESREPGNANERSGGIPGKKET